MLITLCYVVIYLGLTVVLTGFIIEFNAPPTVGEDQDAYNQSDLKVYEQNIIKIRWKATGISLLISTTLAFLLKAILNAFGLHAPEWLVYTLAIIGLIFSPIGIYYWFFRIRE